MSKEKNKGRHSAYTQGSASFYDQFFYAKNMVGVALYTGNFFERVKTMHFQ